MDYFSVLLILKFFNHFKVYFDLTLKSIHYGFDFYFNHQFDLSFKIDEFKDYFRNWKFGSNFKIANIAQQFILNLDYGLFSISWICFAAEFHFRLDNIGFRELRISQLKVFWNFFSLKKFEKKENCFKLQNLNFLESFVEFVKF